MIDDLLIHPEFAESEPCASLRGKPLGFVDIGARGGVHEVVEPLAGVTAVLGFEPDEEECARMRAELATTSPWAMWRIEAFPLAAGEGESLLFLTAGPMCHSLRPPNVEFIRRYNISTMEKVGSARMRTTSLDTILFGPFAAQDYWGEFLKVDSQGMEFEVLDGAQRTLAERTVAILTEVDFFRAYEGEKLFSEIELFLRELGFSFYGFATIHYRSRKLLDKTKEAGRERAFYADAVFFKDPLAGGKQRTPLSERGSHVLFACAMLLGYYDFALELALETWAVGAEAGRIEQLVHKRATLSLSQACEDAVALAERVRANPGRANIEIGRFVDQRRHRCDYDDVR